MTTKEFPLYPELTETGQKEAQSIMEKFSADMIGAVKACLEEAGSHLYTDVLPHIESDSWTNYRNELVAGLSDYRNKHHAEYDFAKIRRAMFEEYREEITKDLNQDLVKEVDRLKDHIKFLQERRH